MQPIFDPAWGGADGMYAQRLGRPRAAALNRFADLAAAGVPLAFGSDAPVTPIGPWAAVRAAACMHDPAAAISTAAAFVAHTRGGWRAAGRPEAGTLEPGAPATFAVWAAAELRSTLPDGGRPRSRTAWRRSGPARRSSTPACSPTESVAGPYSADT